MARPPGNKSGRKTAFPDAPKRKSPTATGRPKNTPAFKKLKDAGKSRYFGPPPLKE